MPGRLRQKNSLGECQSCGDWPNNPQQYTANCPTGSTGDSVTVIIPAGTYYADTIENADELALEEAQEQAEAALQCVFPDCTYEPIPSYASAGETAWKQFLYQLTTTSDPDDGILERAALSDDGKRVIFSRTGFGPAPEAIGAWVVDTSLKPTDGSGSFRGFWISGMTPFEIETGQDYAQPESKQALTRNYSFIGANGGLIENQTWRSTDYSTPETAADIASWKSISGNGETRIGVDLNGDYLIRCDDEPDLILPTGATALRMNYCGTRAIGTNAASANGFWDKTGAGAWEFTERPIQAGWESDAVEMSHINGGGDIIFGTRSSGGNEYLVRWVDGVPTAYANPDGFTIGMISEDGTTAVKELIYDLAGIGEYPASIWDPVNGFRNLKSLVDAVNFLFVAVGPGWDTHSVNVRGISGNGKHLLLEIVGPSFDSIYAMQYVYLG